MFFFGNGGGGGVGEKPFPQMWTPKDDSGCVIWYDFADASTITVTGAGISQITNKVPGGTYTLTQSTDSARPTWDGSQATGRTAGGGLAISTTVNWTNAAYTIIYSSKLGDFTALNGREYNILDNAGAYNYHTTIRLANENRTKVKANSSLDSTGEFNAEVAYVADTTLAIRARTFNGQASGSITTYKNGTAGASLSGALVNPIAGGLFAILRNDTSNVSMGDFVVTTSADDATRQKYEGYLAWKRGLVGDLPANHPYKYSPPYTSLWTPANDPAAIIWYDFADPLTITVTGAGISQITNKINAGTFALTQSTDADRPSWSGSEATARWSSGSSTGLSITTAINWTNAAYMIMAVADPDDTNTVSAPRLFAVRTGTSVNHGIYNGASVLVYRASSSTTGASTILSGYTQGTQRLISLAFNGATNKKAWIFGTSVLDDTSANNGPKICDNFNLLSADGDNKVSDFVVTADTSTAMRQKYEGYLAWKRGLFTNLDVSHPFRYRPPAISD